MMGWRKIGSLSPVRIRDIMPGIIALLNVLMYFNHQVTNSVCEGVNSKIQTIIMMAYGSNPILRQPFTSIVEA